MLEQNIKNLLILVLVFGPLELAVSLDSLKYHAAKYQASPKAVSKFVDGMVFPLRVFYRFNLRGMYYDYRQYSVEQIMRSHTIKRVLASILPVLAILAITFNLIRMALGHVNFNYMYVVYLVVLSAGLWLAWRFGEGLRDVEISQQELNTSQEG